MENLHSLGPTNKSTKGNQTGIELLGTNKVGQRNHRLSIPAKIRLSDETRKNSLVLMETNADKKILLRKYKIIKLKPTLTPSMQAGNCFTSKYQSRTWNNLNDSKKLRKVFPRGCSKQAWYSETPKITRYSTKRRKNKRFTKSRTKLKRIICFWVYNKTSSKVKSGRRTASEKRKNSIKAKMTWRCPMVAKVSKT